MGGGEIDKFREGSRVETWNSERGQLDTDKRGVIDILNISQGVK